jgi:hypothetical protein
MSKENKSGHNKRTRSLKESSSKSTTPNKKKESRRANSRHTKFHVHRQPAKRRYREAAWYKDLSNFSLIIDIQERPAKRAKTSHGR